MRLNGQVEVIARQNGGRVGNRLRASLVERSFNQGGQARCGNSSDKVAPSQSQTVICFRHVHLVFDRHHHSRSESTFTPIPQPAQSPQVIEGKRIAAAGRQSFPESVQGPDTLSKVRDSAELARSFESVQAAEFWQPV